MGIHIGVKQAGKSLPYVCPDNQKSSSLHRSIRGMS